MSLLLHAAALLSLVPQQALVPLPAAPDSPELLVPGDVGTILDRITIQDVIHPFQRTLGEHDEFGGALAALGDSDGDGLQELAIGAAGDFVGRGAVWLFAMRTDRTIASYTKLGPIENLTFELDPGDRFGTCMAPLGDLDGDGRADLAVGAPGDDDGFQPPFGDAGALYVLFLRGNGSVREHLKLGYGSFPGTLATGDQFGSAVAFLGDLDGNGIPDLAVGAPGDGPRTGAVWILFFAADRSVIAAQKIAAGEGGFGGVLENNDEFGSSLVSLGDLDGDGTHELAVGAPGTDLSGAESGAVWILSLASDGTVARETRAGPLFGQLASHRLGASLARLSDLDADGVADLAAGAPHNALSNAEAVFVVFLNSDATVKGSFRLVSPGGVLSDFGSGVAAPGDSNGDGRPDLVVGAATTDTRIEDSGALAFYDLLPTGAPAAPPLRVDAGNSPIPIAPRFFDGTDDDFGRAVAALGELDGTGLPEIAVGAPQDDDDSLGPATDTGAVWIHFLTPVGGERVAKISDARSGIPLQSLDRFGQAVAGIGDLDGDGLPDLAVGAPGDDQAGANRGALWILFLRRNGTVSAMHKILPDIAAGQNFLGESVEAIGDLDGDGATDLAVGTGCGSSVGNKEVWIVFLSPDGTVKSQVKLDRTLIPIGSECFGRSLAYLGVSPATGATQLAIVGHDRSFRVDLGADGAVLAAARHDNTREPLAAVGDIDGDGVLDTAGMWDNQGAFLLLRNADWSVRSSLSLIGALATGLEPLGDLSGDGIADIALTTRSARGSRLLLLQLGGVASAGFELRDDGSQRELENGRQIPVPHPGRTFVISSGGANLGATAFDSTPAGPNDPSQDNDLLVSSGKVLILQDSQVPTQTVHGIFDRPNDDADGGLIAFDFPTSVRALSIELADIDRGAGQGATVRLLDDLGLTRVYDVQPGFTEDRVADGGTGLRKLDLTTLATQPGFAGNATAAEQAGFDSRRVVRIEVELQSSGAVDDLVFDPYP